MSETKTSTNTNANANPVQAMVEARFGKAKLAELRNLFHGRKLNAIVVDDKMALLAPLTSKALGNYTRLVVDPESGIDVAARALLNELWLAGDEEIREDEEYFISAMMELQNIIELKKSSFTKL